MKKIFLLLSLIFALIFTFTACDDGTGDKNTGECAHSEYELKNENVIDATCDADGSMDVVKYCTACGEELERDNTVIPGGHNETVDEGREPDCKNEGLTEGKHCTVCGEVTVEQSVLPVKDHTEGDEVSENVIEPDCESDGSCDKVVYCTVCGDEISRREEVIPTDGHKTETVPGYSATDTEDGLTDGKKCTVCGDITEQQKVIPARISGTDLEAVKLNKNGTTLTLTVENNVKTFDFASDIRVNKTSSFKLSLNSDGSSSVTGFGVDLSEGENVFYITVTDKNGASLTYLVKITREASPVVDDIVVGNITIPAYSGKPTALINNNVPHFTEEEIVDYGFYEYSELDALGRAGVAFGCIGPDTLPQTPRQSISSMTPSGWKYNGVSNNKYYSCVPGGQTVYNRTHLFANMLVENDVDKRNFVTGTHDMNQIYMKEFETQICDYVKETGDHVMYRVTPVFEGDNLICSGLMLEGYSVSDDGASICFCVFLYNVQPGVVINYLTGENEAENGEDPLPDDTDPDIGTEVDGVFEEGKAYYFIGVYSGNKKLYWNGTANSNGMQTATDQAGAVKVYFEHVAGVENGYKIYILDGTSKKYLVMTGNDTTKMRLSDTASTYWIYDEEKGALVSSLETGNTNGGRVLATDSTRSDIRAYYENSVGEGKKYTPLLIVEAE